MAALLASLKRPGEHRLDAFESLMVVCGLRRHRYGQRFYRLGYWVDSPLSCIHAEGVRRVTLLVKRHHRGASVARFEDPVPAGHFRTAAWRRFLVVLADEGGKSRALCAALDGLSPADRADAEHILVSRLGLINRDDSSDPRFPAAVVHLKSRWGIAALEERLPKANPSFRRAIRRALRSA